MTNLKRPIIERICTKFKNSIFYDDHVIRQNHSSVKSRSNNNDTFEAANYRKDMYQVSKLHLEHLILSDFFFVFSQSDCCILSCDQVLWKHLRNLKVFYLSMH